MNDDRCRFCKLYAISLAVLAGLIGVVITIQFGLGLGKFDAREHVSRLVFLSAMRRMGPAINGTALLLSLLIWAHPLSATALTEQLPRILKRGLLISAPGMAAALVLILTTSLFTAAILFDVPAAMFVAGIRVIQRLDLAACLLGTLADALLITLLAWRGLVPLQRQAYSLPAKLAIVVPVSFVLRSLVGLLLPTLG